jgi:hypothetical protein
MKKEYDFSKGKRGAVVQPEPGKSRITIRLDTRFSTGSGQRPTSRGAAITRP